MTSPLEPPKTSDADRLRYWFVAYLILWGIGLYAASTSSSSDLSPGKYVFVL
jgi:hypothetical protein